MEPSLKSEDVKIEIKEEIPPTQPKCEPVAITFDTIQTNQIKREKADFNDSTACSAIHNLEQVPGVSQRSSEEEDQLMQSHSPAACTSTSSAGNSKQLTRTPDKHFSCDICTKKFSRRGVLKRHLLIHTGHKPFTCDICSKKFYRRESLKRHQLIHTGHKQFTCDICSKKFSLRGHLKEHMFTHTGEKPFRCDVCSKTFSQTRYLKTHVLIHTGHKPFTCDICSKKCSRRGDLKKHLLIHTGHEPFMIVVLCVMLGIVEFDRSVRCVALLWEHILGYLAILAGSLFVELFISVVAMRGSILDTEARAPMRYLLYIRLGIMMVELVWLVLGVVWLTYHYYDCPIQGAKEAVLGIVICNWCVMLSVLITVWCTFDAAGRSWVKMKKYQRSMREAESRFQYKRSGTRHRNWRQRKVIRAYQDSWDHRCRLLFCCMRNSDRNRNSFTDIARLLSDFFRDLDVVPSDVVAGLVLLRKFQKIEREAIVKQRKNDTYEYLSGVAVTSHTQFLALNDPEHLEHFQSVIHYMHFALGAYGWPMFLMTHSGTGVCQLCMRLRCMCLPCVGANDGATIVSDNCCQCNYAALRRMVEVGEVEVVYATYHVDVGETPFFVAVDYTRHKIVISIRGTLSMKDVITDLNAEGEPLPLNPPREDWLGHKGMVLAAEYIRDKLEEEGILARAFNHNEERGTQDFELVLVGHSLGAGTASILAILLRQQYSTLQCFAYSPPGGSLSMPAVEYTKSFITSVVVGKDVVPRIGLHQLESLRADLINTIKRSKDPKWKTIVCSVVCCGCASLPTSAAELKAEESQMSEYLKAKEIAREIAVHPSDCSISLTLHQPLYPPGRIIHIVRHHPTKGEQKYEKRWRQVLNKHEPVYQAVWANNTDFDEVLISPVMIQDHMPDNVLSALNKVITTIGPAKPQRIITSNNNSTVTSVEHLESERSHLLATIGPVPGSPKAATPPHKLCLETSFTSLQSPSSDVQQNPSLNSSTCSTAAPTNNGRVFVKPFNNITSPFALHPVLSWEYASLLEEQLLASFHNCNSEASNTLPYSSNTFGLSDSQKTIKMDLIHDDWFGLAPLATPESLSEVSSISSRASSLMFNIDRTLKDMFGHHRGCSASKSPRFLRRTPNVVSGLVKVHKRDRTHSSSGDEDLSFESAQQHVSSDDDHCNNSSDVFVSVKGTPFSSEDSVTINAEVHLDEKSCRTAVTPLCRSIEPSVSSMDNSVVIVSSSPKHVTFVTPQSEAVVVQHSLTENEDNGDSAVGLEGLMVLHLGNASNYNHKLYEDCCDEADSRRKLPEVVNKNVTYVEDNASPLTDNNNSASNNNMKDFQLESKRSHNMGTGLPLLSSIGAHKKYAYSITSVGKGESSV